MKFSPIKIIEKRIELGLTQQDLAVKVGCNQSVVSNWEAGVRKPTARYIGQLATAFKVNPGYFFE